MRGSFIYAGNLNFDKRNNTYEYSCNFNSKYFDIGLYDKFNIKCPIEIQRSSLLRQAEYLAGRYSAKQVLTALHQNNQDVGRNSNRSPIWPGSITGSISHTSKIALSCAADISLVKKIGVDIEPWFSETVSEEIKHEILSAREIEVASGIKMPFTKILTLCFSAKESIYKALGRFNEHVSNFKQLEFKSISLNNKTIEFKLIDDIANNSEEYFLCDFVLEGEYTITRYYLK